MNETREIKIGGWVTMVDEDSNAHIDKFVNTYDIRGIVLRCAGNYSYFFN